MGKFHRSIQPDFAGALRNGKAICSNALAISFRRLGKQMLGQRDVAVALSGPKGGPAQSERVTVSTTDPIEAARVYQRFMGEDK
jgi:hypothetical protein